MLRIENLTIYFRRRNVMKLANRAYFFTLTLLILAFAVSGFGQNVTNARSAEDPRNTTSTVGTGGPVGGPTGLFTVYDGQTLRRGEYTFSAAYSNYDRDPGNVDITDVPLSFQIGLTNNIELFFNTIGYRGIKVNAPRNLSSFYLPNSQVRIGSFVGSAPAIVLAPQGPGVSLFPNQAIFRPTGSQPFVQFPYVGPIGNFGFPSSVNTGALFGFPTGGAQLGPPRATSGHGADEFPGVGSVFGSILPGVVFATTTITPPGNRTIEIPTSFATAPSYLPDAPFVNRTWGESAFNSFTGGVKWRFTNVLNPIGVGLIASYTFYADGSSDFSGFNQLQRGASPGGSNGDINLTLFADARVSKHFNLSANLGYTWTSNPKGDFPNGKFTLLHRPAELMGAVGADFPINRYFQPILELRALRYVGGHTPNAFPQNPIDGLAGFRIYPARWMSFGFAYRYNFNEQDEGYFNQDDSFNQTVLVPCFTVATQLPSGTAPPPCFTLQPSTIKGVPPGFSLSEDPHGYIFQFTVGRRNPRAVPTVNHPADVTVLALGASTISLPCPAGYKSTSGGCTDSTTITLATTAVDPDNDVLTYNYTVSGGRIVGQGANVQWDLSGVPMGTYTVTAGVDDGCGICGKTVTQSVVIQACPDCVKLCDCGTLAVNGPAGLTETGGVMTFTAALSGSSNDNPTYNWTVSEGTIESGQGTPSITVRAPSNTSGGNITATVDIGGWASGCDCPHSGSASGPYGGKPVANLVDTLGPAKDDDVKARVDNFYTQLNANPNSQGYIINYGTPADIKKRRAQITKAINFRKYDPSRVTFVDGPDKGTGIETRFYLVPPGADNPQP